MEPIKKVLKNGMRVVIVPLKDSQLVSLGIFVQAGSKNENDRTNGLAHFLEHMMFKGTINRTSDEIMSTLDNLGASYNAATSYEFTFYEIHGHKDDTMKFLEIMTDLYLNPAFPEKDMEIEKGVVIEEINMTHDNHNRQVSNDLHRVMYKGYPMERTIIGNKKNILNMKRNDLIEFRKKYYVPKKSVFVVAGNVDSKKVMAFIEKNFQDIKNPKEYSGIPKTEDMQKGVNLLVKHKPELSQKLVMIGFRGADMNNKDKYVLNIISDILSSGFTSRLFELLRTKLGATYFNSADHDDYIDHGIFSIYMGISEGKLEEAIKGVFQEIKRLKKEKVPKKELDKVKKKIEVAMHLQLTKPRDHVLWYGFNEMFYGKNYPTLEEEGHIYQDISPEEIKRVANKYFVKDRLNVIAHGQGLDKQIMKSLVKLFKN